MRKKYVIIFVLLLALVLPAVIYSADLLEMRTEDLPTTEELLVHENYFSTEFFENEKRAQMFYMQLNNEYQEGTDGHVMWPSYYGGCFIDENGNLVVNIVLGYEDSDMFSSTLRDILSHPSVSTRVVASSHTELLDLMDFLYEWWRANPYCEINRANTTLGLCVINNRIEVGLLGYSEELKEAFRSQVIDSPLIVFVEGWPVVTRQKWIYVGEYIPQIDE